MFFSRRPRSGRDRFLPLKMATLIVGGVLGLVGMRAESSLLVAVAIGVVLVGFLLRFVRGSGFGEREPGSSSEAPEPPDPRQH